MDLFWRDTLTCPSEDDYLQMVDNKTGGLFRLAVKLMQAESSQSLCVQPPVNSEIETLIWFSDCVPLVNLIGTLFQIRDDYMNLSSTEYTSNKGLCEDLTEGKFSFPIIHSIRSNPQNLQLINILKQKTTDDGVKRYAVSFMESTGSFEYCRRKLRELKSKAISMIEIVETTSGHGVSIRKILDNMDVVWDFTFFRQTPGLDRSWPGVEYSLYTIQAPGHLAGAITASWVAWHLFFHPDGNDLLCFWLTILGTGLPLIRLRRITLLWFGHRQLILCH